MEGKPHSRINSQRIPRFDLPFLRYATNIQPGNQSTAAKDTASGERFVSQDFGSSEAFRLCAGLIDNVVLAVLLDAKFRLLGLKLQVMYCDRFAGRLHAREIVPVKSVAVHVIVAFPESPESVIVGMVQLTLGGGSATPESCTC